MTLETAPFRVEPGTRVDLTRWPTTAPAGREKKEARAAHKALNKRLEELQEVLYAQGKHRLLVFLQAMDTGGKDVAIRRVFDGVNPQGVKVASFKKPTAAELAHDYLWRVHPHVPGNGEIAIFNRSHYEDVLVVRVHRLVPEGHWARRYDHINAFEKLLSDEATTILKFFLHISQEEQAARLQPRLDDPAKHWKFSLGDLEERSRWDEYREAYQAAVWRTSTPWAPWYVVPADQKWFRDLLISSVMVETLERLGLDFPASSEDLSDVIIT